MRWFWHSWQPQPIASCCICSSLPTHSSSLTPPAPPWSVNPCFDSTSMTSSTVLTQLVQERVYGWCRSTIHCLSGVLILSVLYLLLIMSRRAIYLAFLLCIQPQPCLKLLHSLVLMAVGAFLMQTVVSCSISYHS